MSYLVSKDKKECFGCGCCQEICPIKCIVMTKDKEGFSYPKINMEQCINCRKCITVCPYQNNLKLIDKDFQQEVFAAVNRDEKILYESSSGGAFDAIIKSYCQRDDMVFGVSYDTNLQVMHQAARANVAGEKFRKSKYVQSEVGHTYSEAKKFLQEGKKVLYSGTPCQIEGLKAYLGKQYDNLLTVDVVCHGVPSQKIFDKYIHELEKKYHDTILKVEFRHKEFKHRKWDSKLLKVIFTSGKDIVLDYNTSEYLRGYANGLFFRPSCSICQFASNKRVSDLTIADFWGISSYKEDLDEHKGTSLIIANSPKGKEIVAKMGNYMELYDIDYEKAIKHNARLRNPDKGHTKRAEFFENLDSESFYKNVNKLIPPVPVWKRKLYGIKCVLIKALRK